MASNFENKIIRQVEFYFGDSNIVRDKFLLEEIQKNDEGWVPMEILLKFKRLASLSDYPLLVTGALRKSESGSIEVSEDGMKIRRVKPILEITNEIRREIALRTVYCKGINKSATLDELLKFFKNFGDVEKITMRYYGSKKEPHFKGTALVKFKTREDADFFLKQENVKYENVYLFRQWYDDWSAEKRELFSKK
jgi:lupus La protein